MIRMRKVRKLTGKGILFLLAVLMMVTGLPPWNPKLTPLFEPVEVFANTASIRPRIHRSVRMGDDFIIAERDIWMIRAWDSLSAANNSNWGERHHDPTFTRRMQISARRYIVEIAGSNDAAGNPVISQGLVRYEAYCVNPDRSGPGMGGSDGSAVWTNATPVGPPLSNILRYGVPSNSGILAAVEGNTLEVMQQILWMRLAVAISANGWAADGSSIRRRGKQSQEKLF
jgi:hypothetical protein